MAIHYIHTYMTCPCYLHKVCHGIVFPAAASDGPLQCLQPEKEILQQVGRVILFLGPATLPTAIAIATATTATSTATIVVTGTTTTTTTGTAIGLIISVIVIVVVVVVGCAHPSVPAGPQPGQDFIQQSFRLV